MIEQGKGRLDAIAKSDEQWLVDAELNQANKSWLDRSKRIAVKVLLTLREKGMSQSDLAEKLNISKQMVSKLVQGKENLKLSTICNLENLLGVDLLEYIVTGCVELETYSQNYFKPEMKSKAKNLEGSEEYYTQEPIEHTEFKRFSLPVAA